MRVSLIKRIKPQDLADYLNRRLTSKEIAALYGTKISYVIKALPKRPPRDPLAKSKAQLAAARREYRGVLAQRVNAGELTIKEAANQAFCTIRTMYRYQAQERNRA